MDEPSPTARDVLAAYRRRRVLTDEAHERVQARLGDSIARHDHRRSVGEARQETWRRLAIASVFALAAAAAIVLLVRGLRSDAALAGAHDERGQAPYKHTTDDRELPLDPRTHEAAAIVESFVATLGADQRAVFVLVEIEGTPMPEVAEALGVNLNTLYSRLRLARRRFEQHLVERGEPHDGVDHGRAEPDRT